MGNVIIMLVAVLFVVLPIVIISTDCFVDRRVKDVEKLSKHKPSIVRIIHDDNNYKEYKRGETGFTTGRFMYKKFSNVETCVYIEVRFDVNRQLFVDATDLKWVKYCDLNAKPYDNTIVDDGIITYGYKLYTEDDIRKTNDDIRKTNLKTDK